MLKIIKKDFGMLRTSFIFIVVYGLFFPMFMQSNVVPIIGLLGPYLIIIGAFGAEERDKIDLLHKSLPVTAGEIVGAKYAEGILTWFFTILLGFAGTYIAFRFNLHVMSADIWLSSSWSVILMSFIIAMVMMSVSIPVIYKTGFARARIILTIVWVVIVCSMPTLGVFLNLSGTVFEIDGIWNYTLIILTAAAILMLIVSYRISVKIYKK